MYGWLWRHLPGPWPVRLVELLALALGVVALLFYVVFPAADPHLPETGVSLEWERWLSPAFIRAPGYGTRCSSVVLRDETARTRFVEWTWDVHGELCSQVEHRFRPSVAG